MKHLEKTFKAFGNITRLKIISLLKKKKTASVGQISEGVKCSYKAASKHLSILFRVDLVDREQRGYEMHYRLADDMSSAGQKITALIDAPSQ